MSQMLYLHMKNSIFLVELKVYTITFNTGLERRNATVKTNNEQENTNARTIKCCWKNKQIQACEKM